MQNYPDTHLWKMTSIPEGLSIFPEAYFNQNYGTICLEL